MITPDGYVYEREFGQSMISEIKIKLIKLKLDTLLTVEDGQTVEVWRGWTTPTDEKIFSGWVRQRNNDGFITSIVGYDKLVQALDKEITYSYDKDIDASAGEISEIWKDVVTTHAELNADAGTVQESGSIITLQKFICNHTPCFERMKRLADVLDWQQYYKASDDKVYFEPKGFNNNSIVLRTGENILDIPVWEFDSEKVIKDLIIIGAVQEVETTETFTGDGSTKIFTLAHIPKSVKVFVNETLKIGGIPSSTSTFDYKVDKDNKKITFEIAPVTGDTVATGTTLNNGDLTGSTSDTHENDGVRLIVGEVAGDGLCIDMEFTVPLDGEADEVDINGYYSGSSTHYVDVYAFNYKTNLWDLLSDQDNRMENESSDQDYNYTLNQDHTNNSDGEVKIRFWHVEGTYNNAHDLLLDFVQLSYSTNIEVRYSYNIPVPVTGSNTIAGNYGKERTIFRTDIEEVTDAEALLQKMLDTYKEPFITVNCKVLAATNQNIAVGQQIRIDDNINNEDRWLLITKYTIRYPGEYDEVILGDREIRTEDWFKDLEVRIHKLEEDASRNKDLLIHVINVFDKFALTPESLTIYKRGVGTACIAGHAYPGLAGHSNGKVAGHSKRGAWAQIYGVTY
ncbi:hypothetical protein KAR91_44550 [Candidatus Pacearchaeota archaeon]|nr:hypothetical protein [Candidatus Pacearchaeota archaeon]